MRMINLLKCLVLGHNGKTTGRGVDVFVKCERCGLRSPGIQLEPIPRERFTRAAPRSRRTVGRPFESGPLDSDWALLPQSGVQIAHLASMDQATTDLVADLNVAGRDRDLELLLMPPVNNRKH